MTDSRQLFRRQKKIFAAIWMMRPPLPPVICPKLVDSMLRLGLLGFMWLNAL
jgi:hypothetical protein